MTPRVVLVTGAPGSGKSTLGSTIAREVRMPFLARDDVRGGLAATAGVWRSDSAPLPAADLATDRFVDLVVGMLTAGVSCVVEYVVRDDEPEPFDRLIAGDCVVVICRSDRSMARVADRNRTDRLVARPAVLAAGGFDTVDEHTSATLERMAKVAARMRTEFPVPTLEVDTSDGYRPDVERIVTFVTA